MPVAQRAFVSLLRSRLVRVSPPNHDPCSASVRCDANASDPIGIESGSLASHLRQCDRKLREATKKNMELDEFKQKYASALAAVQSNNVVSVL